MLNILNSLVDIIIGIFEFIVKIVHEIIYIIKLLGSIASNLSGFFYFLPVTVTGIIITLITIAIGYKIAGRD